MAAGDILTLVTSGEMLSEEKQIGYWRGNVTGTLTMETGFKTVYAVSLTLEADLADAACGVSCAVSNQTTEPGQITPKVWKHDGSDPTPATATVAAAVSVIVIGKADDN